MQKFKTIIVQFRTQGVRKKTVIRALLIACFLKGCKKRLLKIKKTNSSQSGFTLHFVAMYEFNS